MPLEPGNSPRTVAQNIQELRASGKRQRAAVAIALHNRRRVQAKANPLGKRNPTAASVSRMSQNGL